MGHRAPVYLVDVFIERRRRRPRRRAHTHNCNNTPTTNLQLNKIHSTRLPPRSWPTASPFRHLSIMLMSRGALAAGHQAPQWDARADTTHQSRWRARPAQPRPLEPPSGSPGSITATRARNLAQFGAPLARRRLGAPCQRTRRPGRPAKSIRRSELAAGPAARVLARPSVNTRKTRWQAKHNKQPARHTRVIQISFQLNATRLCLFT